MALNLPSIIAIATYIIAWFFYLWLVDYSPWSKKTLSHLVAQRRVAWMKAAAQREHRIVDSSMLSGQMQGALFYASSSLLALAGCFALLTNREEIVNLLLVTLNQPNEFSVPIEFKIMALMCLFAYCFFKFGWSFRLYTYSSVLVGSIPNQPSKNITETGEALLAEIDKVSTQAAHINIQAARHFDRGQRAIFASLPLLSWFVGDNIMIICSIITVLAMIRRQFLSQSVFILK